MVFLNPPEQFDFNATPNRIVKTDTSGNLEVSSLQYNEVSGNVTLTNSGELSFDYQGALTLKTGSTSSITLDASGNVVSHSNLTVLGNAILNNLTVTGTTTQLNTEQVLVEDNEIVLNSNSTGSPTVDSRFAVKRGSSSAAILDWNEATDSWGVGISGGNLVTFTNGAIVGSSIDVSGNSEANQFLINGSTAVNSSNTFVGTGGISTVGTINTDDRYRIDSVDVINTSRTFVGSGGVSTVGTINTDDKYNIDGQEVINSSRTFVGSGGVFTSSQIIGSSFTVTGGGITSLGSAMTLSTNSFIDFQTSLTPQWRIETDGSLNAFNSNGLSTAGGDINTFGGQVTCGRVNADSIVIDNNLLDHPGQASLRLDGTARLDALTRIDFSLQTVPKWTMALGAGNGDGSWVATGGQYIAVGGGVTHRTVNASLDIGPQGNGTINLITNFGSTPNFFMEFNRIGNGLIEFSKWAYPRTNGGINLGGNGIAFGSVFAFAYPGSSDSRQKQNVQNIGPVSDQIKELRPVTFDWIPISGSSAGLIAQEVLTVSGIGEHIVSGSEEEMYSVNYQGLIPFLIKGLQEAYARIEALESA